jgi:hypothetical protein
LPSRLKIRSSFLGAYLDVLELHGYGLGEHPALAFSRANPSTATNVTVIGIIFVMTIVCNNTETRVVWLPWGVKWRAVGL